MEEYTLYINPKMERPRFKDIAHFLWGEGVDLDSDGNSETPDDRNWTELTLINRNDGSERIDIDPVSYDPLILKIVGHKGMVSRVAVFLSEACGCKVSESASEFEI